MNQPEASPRELKDHFIHDITEYMKFGGAESEADPNYDPERDSGYTQDHVDRCSAILDEYLDTLAAMNGNGDPADIMENVKKAVLALNNVDEESGGGMIETDQREQLCLIIDRAARLAGMEIDDYDDIGGEWRDW